MRFPGYTNGEKERKELTDMAAVNYTNEEFNNALQAGKTFLVDYWAPWCSYCRRIGPAYEKIAESWGDEIVVAKINIDDSTKLEIKSKQILTTEWHIPP